MNKFRNKDVFKNKETKKLTVTNEKKYNTNYTVQHLLSKKLVNQRCILLY